MFRFFCACVAMSCLLYSPTTQAGSIIASGTFDNGAITAFKHTNHAAVLLHDGRVFINIGDIGTTSGNAIFDPATRLWTLTPQAPSNNGGTAADVPLVLLDDGRVFWAGSADTLSSRSIRAMIYDPVANTNTQVADMPTARWGEAAWLTNSGNVLVAGGDTTTGHTNHSEVFDVGTGLWSATASLPTYWPTDMGWWGPNTKDRTGNLNGSNLFNTPPVILGGIDDGGMFDESVDWVKEFVGGVWKTAFGGGMLTSRDSFTISAVTPSLSDAGDPAINGPVYELIAGGHILNTLTATDDPTAFCELMDNHSMYVDAFGNPWITFLPAAPMPEARMDAASASLPGFERVAVFGGWNDVDLALDTIAIYDAPSNTWYYDPAIMTEARYDETVTRLNNGDYLIAGGRNDAGVSLESWEIWRP